MNSNAQAWPTVLVLAAGQGRRFTATGGQGSKLNALWQGQPIWAHTWQAVQATQLPCHIERGALQADGTWAGHPFMGDSIAAAVAQTPNPVGWLILPADLPLIQPATLLQVAARLRQCVGQNLQSLFAIRPFYQGQEGHPVAFSAALGTRLLALKACDGAQSVLQHAQVHRLDVADAGTVRDVDTVADWHRLQCQESPSGL